MSSTYRRTKARTGRIVKALEDKLREFAGESDLANAKHGSDWLRATAAPFTFLLG